MTRRVLRSIGEFNDVRLRRDVVRCMEKEGWSQRGVADRVGMSPGTVARWFRGEGRASADMAVSLVLACGLDLASYVMWREDAA